LPICQASLRQAKRRKLGSTLRRATVF
jgi:hypothetical protein